LADLATTQAQLRATPTAGLAGEHSAWYRRLLSAGYKGHIQGAIGGATLYGSMGLLLGTVLGVSLAPFTGGSSLWLIPTLGGIGTVHGASTFADIGKTAAIIAEDSELSEKRRTLLNRYYDDSTGEAEKQELAKQLDATTASHTPDKVFHWKTVLVGAILGGAIAFGLALLAGSGMAIPFALSELGAAAGHAEAGAIAAKFAFLTPVVIGAVGAAAGGLIGLDREYIRRWMDGAETVVSEPSRLEKEFATREHEVNKITQAAKRDKNMASGYDTGTNDEIKPAASTVTPTNSISDAELNNRISPTNHLQKN
jgi:hypothetical protein